MTQKEKSKFRASSKWKNFRSYLAKKRKVDYISQRPLRSGFNVHHCDEKHYDLLDEERFYCLQKSMHQVVHRLYTYYKKDPTIIERLEEILQKMQKYDN